jgi:gliding motility-associated-like protein
MANIYNGYGISCEGSNDGAIQTNVQGGKAPYTYTWNNGSSSPSLSNLSEGTYVVIVEDSNGCLSTESITIDEPNALSYVYVIEDVTCYDIQDGKIELYPTGGVAPYTINWFDGSSSNFLNNLDGAYYSFTIVDANNCSTSDSLEVYEPADLFITVDTIQPTCERINDGEIDAFISGGTYPYSYSLNGTGTLLPIDSIAVGTYLLTVTDNNNCTKSLTLDLSPLQPSCFMIPNIYSPNNDGYNDEFRIKHSSWSSYTITIYNPIGQLIFSGSSNTPYWDGFSNGEPMPTGDYYYQLITNEGEVFYNYVTLIR